MIFYLDLPRSPHDVTISYDVKLLPGNNGRVLLACLRKRPWWHASAKAEAATTDNELSVDLPSFVWEMYRNPKRYKDTTYCDVMLNHLEHNNCLVTKKGLYLSLKAYCSKNKDINLLNLIPRTYYLASGSKTSTESRSADMAEFLAFNDNPVMHGDTKSLISNDVSRSSIASISQKSTCSDSESELGCSLFDQILPKPPIKNYSDEVLGPESVPELVWILKPASKTNRGFGIKVVRGVREVMDVVNRPDSSRKSKAKKSIKESIRWKKDNPETEDVSKSAVLTKAASRLGAQEGWIVQLYMDRPMLVSGRKFDIRCFVLVTNFPRQGLRAYFFKDCYVRTSSKKYSLTSLSDREAHLTNDAVQKNSKTYGKFEDGNKLSFEEWQETILKDYPHAPHNIVEGKFRPEIMRLSAISIAAGAEDLGRTDINRSFELLGYDYMVDDQFQATLIEINSNPCLEFVCPLLVDIISSLIENVVKVALDTQLPPPMKGTRTAACEEAVTEIFQQETKFSQIYPY